MATPSTTQEETKCVYVSVHNENREFKRDNTRGLDNVPSTTQEETKCVVEGKAKLGGFRGVCCGGEKSRLRREISANEGLFSV